jgi:cyclopropane-fatty-acyl-phospholipid synthase
MCAGHVLPKHNKEHPVSAILYWLDFLVVPVLMFVFASDADITGTAISFTLAGYVAWVFFEYFLHRVVFHHRKSPFHKPHRVHHRHPFDADGQPPAGLAPVVLFLFGLACYLTLGHPFGPAFALGFLGGYMTYIVTHHLIHNGTVTGPIALRHELHHKGWAFNYNLMCPLGDLVFGTYREVLR